MGIEETKITLLRLKWPKSFRKQSPEGHGPFSFECLTPSMPAQEKLNQKFIKHVQWQYPKISVKISYHIFKDDIRGYTLRKETYCAPVEGLTTKETND